MHSESLQGGGAKGPRVLGLLLLVFGVLYLPWLSVEPPASGLETTRILVAREMVRSGDWIVPTQNGVTYLAKPPLGYWLIALGSAPFGGVTVVTARLVSVLCMLALAIVVAAFARRELGARVGLLAGLCAMGTAVPLDKGMHAEIEASFALFTTLSILAGFRAVWSERRALLWSIAGGLALGAATLIKGPLAMLVFVLALAAMAVDTRDRRTRVLMSGATALLVGSLVGASWLVALYEHGVHAEDFQRLVDETFRRVTDAGRTNREAFWYYGPTLLVAFLPATILLPALCTREPLVRKGNHRKRSLLALLFGWSVISVLALSASQGKEARYLMPILPGWSLLAAWAWYRPDAPPWIESWRRMQSGIGVGLMWVVPPVLAILGWMFVPSAWRGILVALVLSMAAIVVFGLGRVRMRPALTWGAVLIELLALRVYWAAVPTAVRNAEYPIETMGARIETILPTGEPLVQLGEFSSYVQLQLDHPLRLAQRLSDVPAALTMEPQAHFVLARTSYLAPGQEGDWIEVASWPFGNSRFRLLRVP